MSPYQDITVTATVQARQYLNEKPSPGIATLNVSFTVSETTVQTVIAQQADGKFDERYQAAIDAAHPPYDAEFFLLENVDSFAADSAEE